MAEFIKKFGFGIGCLLAVIVFTIACGLSWIFTCGVVWIVAECFGFTFSWGAATGVWVIAMFISGLIGGRKGE